MHTGTCSLRLYTVLTAGRDWAERLNHAETLPTPYSTYPVAHVLVGMVELGNQGRVLGQLAFSNTDAVLEAHQLRLQLCH